MNKVTLSIYGEAKNIGLPWRPGFKYVDGDDWKHGGIFRVTNEAMNSISWSDIFWPEGVWIAAYRYSITVDAHEFLVSGEELPPVPEGSEYPLIRVEFTSGKRSRLAIGSGGTLFSDNPDIKEFGCLRVV